MFNLTGLTVDYLWGRALNGEDSLDDKKRGNEGLPVLPCFDVVNSEKATAELFAKAMQEFSSTHDYKIDTLVQQFNWQRLGSASIVDIGGSSGFVTVALARAFPRLKIEVQDLLNVIQESTSHPLDPVLGNRVKFVAHDFFQPQTRVDVDVFFIRHVLHNWADLEAVAIIRNLFPALARGKRVLVVDSILHNEEESAPSSLLRSERTLDIIMLTTLNAQERTLKQWKALFAKADPFFKLRYWNRISHSSTGITEFVWDCDGLQ